MKAINYAKKFSWKIAAKEYNAVFESILKKHL